MREREYKILRKSINDSPVSPQDEQAYVSTVSVTTRAVQPHLCCQPTPALGRVIVCLVESAVCQYKFATAVSTYNLRHI